MAKKRLKDYRVVVRCLVDYEWFVEAGSPEEAKELWHTGELGNELDSQMQEIVEVEENA